MATTTIDERYRITIPSDAREGLQPGDVLFIVREQRPDGPVLHAAKAINPLVDVDLEAMVRAAGLDPDHLPTALSAEQQERLTALLREQAVDPYDAR